MNYSPPPIESVLQPQRASAALGTPWRWLLILTGCGLIVPLVIATRLTPSPLGMGTHMQLGLQPCSLVQLAGIRCPACGMTTSWALMVRGQVIQAIQTNSGGAMLAVIVAIVGPWMVGSGCCGRWIIGPPHETATLCVALAVVLVTLIDWVVRLQS